MSVSEMLVWRGRPRPRAFAAAAGKRAEVPAPHDRLALRRYRCPSNLGKSTWHGCDSRTLSLRRSLPRRGHRLRRRRSGNQPQRLAHFRVELGHGVFVVFEELPGVFAALADAFTFIAEPRAGFLENIIVHRDIEQVAFARDAFAIQNVELGLAERRCHFVLHNFYPGTRAGNYVAFLDGCDAPDVDAHR